MKDFDKHGEIDTIEELTKQMYDECQRNKRPITSMYNNVRIIMLWDNDNKIT